MSAAVKIFVNGTLVWSPLPGAANQPVTIRALKVPQATSFLGHALIELQAAAGEFFVTVTPDRPDGVLGLYGPVDGARLTAETRSPVGLAVSLQGEVEQPRPSQGRFLNLDFFDAAGGGLGSFKFRFTCTGVADEALFRVKKARLPELEAEAGRPSGTAFEIETLQPASNAVGYAVTPWSMPTAAFGHGLQQTANRYQNPDGPVVDADYFAAPPFDAREVFILTGSDAQGAEQKVPFISWLVDTPARGELRIAAINPDPAGRDANAETITLENVSARVLNVGKCSLEDEQPMALFGTRLNLPYGTPGRHVIGPGRLNPGDRLVVKPSFAMNNDFDAFALRNRRGRRLDFAGYLRRLPGTLPPAAPRQRVIFRQTVSLTPWVETEGVSLTSALEDGDLVLIRPDPASKLWAGEIPHPWTGPQGWFDANGQPVPPPAGWALPLPSAPLYALLLVSSPAPRLVGNRVQAVVIDRQSKATGGIGAGTARIDFQRNDPSFGRGLAWGQFDIEVMVLRH
jgi:hypothetical protein